MRAGLSDDLWLERPAALLGPDIVPAGWMTVEERLNSIMRLSLLFAAACVALTGRAPALLAPLAVAAVTAAWWALGRPRGAGAERRREGAGRDARCAPPSRDNPYMNWLHTDAPGRGPACDIRDPAVARAADELARSSCLSLGAKTDMDRRAESRSFYTVPSTTALQDRDTFARALFAGMPGKGESVARA